MKIRIKDLYAIARFLEADRKICTDNNHEKFLNYNVDITLNEESIEEGRLASTIEIFLNYNLEFNSSTNKSINKKYETKIEIYSADNKRDPIYRRMVIHGPEEN